MHKNGEINHDFLEMIVTIMGIKNIHNNFKNNTDLLNFGAKSIINLIPKISDLKIELVDKIMQLFLVVDEVRVRSQIAKGLEENLKVHVS